MTIDHGADSHDWETCQECLDQAVKDGILTDARGPRKRTDEEALDNLNLMLSASEWPGASGMEDVCEVVRSTGRREIPNAPEWHRH